MKSFKRQFLEKWIDPSAYGIVFPSSEKISESWDKCERELLEAIEKDNKKEFEFQMSGNPVDTSNESIKDLLPNTHKS